MTVLGGDTELNSEARRSKMREVKGEDPTLRASFQIELQEQRGREGWAPEKQTATACRLKPGPLRGGRDRFV